MVEQGIGVINTKSLFEYLEIWKEGRKLRKELLELVKTFPEYEKYRLSNHTSFKVFNS